MIPKTQNTSHPITKLFHILPYFTTPTTSSPQQPHNLFQISIHNPTHPKYYELHLHLRHHTHPQSHLFLTLTLHPGTLTLLQCGDIKPNPSPTLKLPDTFSPQVHLFYKTYFIPQTISLKPDYYDLNNKFMPLIDSRHPNHSQYKESHKNLCQFAKRYSQYPPHQMLLALITTIHPTPECCNDILQDSQVRSNLPLFKMLNYLKHHSTPLTHTTHILENFYSTHSNQLSKPNSIYQQLYNYIAMQPQPTLDQITAKFPSIPPSLINNALKCKQSIIGYIPPPPPPLHPPPQIHNPTYTSTSASLLSWNIATPNTSLPCIHKLIQKYTPTIISYKK